MSTTTSDGQQAPLSHDVAVASALPLTADNVNSERTSSKAKRPERERRKVERYALLHSMGIEQRRQYLLDEEAHRIERVERMRRAADNASGVQRIAIDLTFDAIMSDNEVRSLANQLKLSYGAIKQMQTPFQLHFVNSSDALKQSLARFGAENWFVHWHDGNKLTDVVAPADIVYLSPDSSNVLTTLDATKTYVIGGIVDKMRKKGTTLRAAATAGVQTARLPIQEHITQRLDHILNVNTVVDVLIGVYENSGDWATALRNALPQRKQKPIGRKAQRRQDKLVIEEQLQLDEVVEASSEAFGILEEIGEEQQQQEEEEVVEANNEAFEELASEQCTIDQELIELQH